MNDLPDSLKDGLSTVLGQPALTITANDGFARDRALARWPSGVVDPGGCR